MTRIAYLEHFPKAYTDVLLVSACVKLNNLQTIHLDLVEIGLPVFDRFSAGRDDVLWYYCNLSEIFNKQKAAPAIPLSKEYKDIERKVGELLGKINVRTSM